MKIATDGIAGRFRPNPVARDRHVVLPEEAVVYAVGDVHGCRTELLELEQRIAADAAATSRRRYIVMLGDYVDFGPDSAGVLDHLMAPPPDGFERICLKGNHEAFFGSFLEKPGSELDWLRLGGAETLASYGVEVEDPHSRRGRRQLAREVDQLVPRQHRAFLNRLSLTARVGDVVLVHAGLRPGVPLEAQKPDDLMLIREEFLTDDGDPGFLVVHGHTVTARPDVARTRIGIDTGAYRTGRLTALKIAPEGLSLLSNLDEAPDPLPASLFAHGPGTISTVRPVTVPPERPPFPQPVVVRSGHARVLRYGALATVVAAAAAFAGPGFLGGLSVEDPPETTQSADAEATGSVKRVTVDLADAPEAAPEPVRVIPLPKTRPDDEPRTELAALTLDENPDTAVVDQLPMVDVPPPAFLPPDRISFRADEDPSSPEPAPWGKTLLGTEELRRPSAEPPAVGLETEPEGVVTAALGDPGEGLPVTRDLSIIPVPKARPFRPVQAPEAVRPKVGEQPAGERPAGERAAKRRAAEPLRRAAQPLPDVDLSPPPPLEFDPPPSRRHFVDVRVCDGWLFGSCRMVRLPVQGIGPDGAVILRGPIAETAPARRQGRARPVTRNGVPDVTRGSRDGGRTVPGTGASGQPDGGLQGGGASPSGGETDAGTGGAGASGGTGAGTGETASGSGGGGASPGSSGGGTGASSGSGKGSSDTASNGKGNGRGGRDSGSSGGRGNNAASSEGSGGGGRNGGGKGGGKGSKG